MFFFSIKEKFSYKHDVYVKHKDCTNYRLKCVNIQLLMFLVILIFTFRTLKIHVGLIGFYHFFVIKQILFIYMNKICYNSNIHILNT